VTENPASRQSDDPTAAAPGSVTNHMYGTSMHWPYCRDGRCTGCLPAFDESRLVPLNRDQPLCDASVPSFGDDEVRYACLHQAEVEAMWTDGVWHPRCRGHVDGYPASRVRPLGGAG
jgi:hypothetical protein